MTYWLVSEIEGDRDSQTQTERVYVCERKR